MNAGPTLVGSQPSRDKTHEEHLQEFDDMCRCHDLTYAFSDDHRYWVAGEASIAKIREASKNILPDEASEIWNKWVDKAVSKEFAHQFYLGYEYWLSLRGSEFWSKKC